MRHQTQRRPGTRKVGRTATNDDRVQVDAIFIDQAEVGEASRQVGTSHFDLPAALGLQCTDRALEIIPNKRGVGTD